MKPAPILAAALALAGCASMTTHPVGPDAFLVTNQGASSFTPIAEVKAGALQQAAATCAAQGAAMHLISASENSGPYILGNFPRADVHFRCVKS